MSAPTLGDEIFQLGLTLNRAAALGLGLPVVLPKIESPVFEVRIIDCEKAGLIGGPFMVVVLKDGRICASTSGIQGPTGAEGVARNYRSAYGLPRFAS